mmetsp:Transcript_5220/g.7673  ORF Transcript_5220/g.7673 Transcript_5220/m.7673 type:complete len:491 (+) Transcript_5220:73-1545(+)
MMNMTHDTAGLEAILLDESSVEHHAFNGSHNITGVPQSMGSSGAFVTIGIAVAGVFFLFVCLASFIRHPENEPWNRRATPVPQQRRKLKPEEMKLLFIIIELMITTRKVVAIVPANEGGDDIEESIENEANHTHLLAEDDEDVYIHLTYPVKRSEKKITRRSVKDFEDAESGGTTIHAPHLMTDNSSGDHQDPSTTLTSTIIPHDETETTDDDDSSDSGDDDSSSLSVPDGTDDKLNLVDLVDLETHQEQQQHQEPKVKDERDTSLVSDPFTTPQVQEGVSSSLSVPDGTDDNLIGLETQHHQELEERDTSPVSISDHLSTPIVEKQEHVDQNSTPQVDEEEEEQQQQQVEHHPAPQVDGEQKQVQAVEQQQEEQHEEEEQEGARVEEPQSFLEQHEECTIHQQEAAQQNISQEPHCVLCFEKYSVGEEVCFSCDPECIHVFHKDCIVEWLARSPNCPCCKRQYLDINLTQLGGDTETEQSSQTEDDDES